MIRAFCSYHVKIGMRFYNGGIGGIPEVVLAVMAHNYFYIWGHDLLKYLDLCTVMSRSHGEV